MKARAVTVKGPRGSLTKSFKHLAVDIYMTDDRTIKIEKWFGKKKQFADVRIVCSHIENLFKGVTKVGLRKLLISFISFIFCVGVSIQDESCLCAFPNQLCYF